jgi:Calponin homology (CH) domain
VFISFFRIYLCAHIYQFSFSCPNFSLQFSLAFLSLFSKLINAAVPDTIDERVLNKSMPMNPFQMTENNNVVINSAKAVGCSVVNIGSQDLIEGRPHLVLGLVWQIIKIGLFAKVSLIHHPELFRLLKEGESLPDLLALSPDAILVRWVNFHLEAAGHQRRIANFSSDIKVLELLRAIHLTLTFSRMRRYIRSYCISSAQIIALCLLFKIKIAWPVPRLCCARLMLFNVESM